MPASEPSPGSTQPLLSVVVPARNCPEYLEACLGSLRRSDLQGFEIIVVDDCSTDHTGKVARDLGVKVVQTQKRGGPGAARNLGAKHASAPNLFFVDADVCVNPETLSRVAETFRIQPDVDAFFGSYDPEPPAKNFLSQYKNLSHHFVHQEGNAEASTFWAGCGAIRSEVFAAVSGFDESYGRPSIEDIELGTRLKKAGYRVRLLPDLQVKHLKRWTLWSMLVADVRDRAIPWTQLILRDGAAPNDLNLRHRHRVSTVLAYLLLLSFVVGAWYFHGLLLLPIAVLLAVLMVDYWSDVKKAPAALHVLSVLVLLGALGAISFYFQMWILVGLVLLLGIVTINFRFYLFFARKRHPLFAAMVVPLHVFYYVYSGAAFALVVTLHVGKSLLSRQRAKATGEPR